jgi:rubrerythrin
MPGHVVRAADFKGGQHMEHATASGSVADDFVDFWSMGTAAKGEFQCAECGYGVTVNRELPRCPMCGGDLWEASDWTPVTRSVSDQPL